MPKQKQSQERELTRKETVRKRREDVANRRMLIALGIVAGLLLAIIAAGVIQELVIKPRLPIATVNGAQISSTEYAKRVRFAWYQADNDPTNTQATDRQSTSLDVLDQMVDEQLLREQAQQRGITVSAAEVDEALEQAFGYQRNTPTPAPTPAQSPTPLPSPTPGGSPTPTPYPTSTPVSLASYQDQVKNYVAKIKTAADMSEADLRALVELDLLRNKLYDAVTKDVPTTQEQVHARHILVRTFEAQPTPTPVPAGQPTPTPDPAATPAPAPRDEAQALARIIEVQQKLGSGADFAQLAKEYSDDTASAEAGGDLGWFGSGQMVAEFDKAAFSLAVGEISQPIQTTYGYHLIQVLEKDPAREMDAYTASQKKYEAYTAWLDGLRTAANIEKSWTADKVPPTPNPLSN